MGEINARRGRRRRRPSSSFISLLLLMLLLLLQLLASAASTTAASTTTSSSTTTTTTTVIPPTFHIDDLAQQQRRRQPSTTTKQAAADHNDDHIDDRLRDVLSTTGLFAVRLTSSSDDEHDNDDTSSSTTGTSSSSDDYHPPNSHNDYLWNRQTALRGLCECYKDPRFLLGPPPSSPSPNTSAASSSTSSASASASTHTMTLMDGITHRTSIGTATIGTSTPLPLLPSHWKTTTTTTATDDEDEGKEYEYQPICTDETVVAMEELRDIVNDVTQAVLRALDRVLVLSRPYSTEQKKEQSQQQQQPLLQDLLHNKDYYTITDIVESSTNLEHFHVYHRDHRQQQQQQQQQQLYDDNPADADADDVAAWEWHTDAGLFLVFVPALDCTTTTKRSSNGNDDEQSADTAFWYQDVDGTQIQAQFDPNTIVVMMGQGIQDWLDLSTTSSNGGTTTTTTTNDNDDDETITTTTVVRPTVHSVRFPSSDSSSSSSTSTPPLERAWYGTMQLVPDHAVIGRTRTGTTATMSELRTALMISKHQQNQQSGGNNDDNNSNIVVSIGCGSSSDVNNYLLDRTNNEDEETKTTSTTKELRSRRRRLQHQDPSGCNNVTNFFCWMQCLDVPDADLAQDYVNDGYSLYCLDPAVLDNNNLAAAVDKCEEGWIHDPACAGYWQPTVDGVPSAYVNYTADPDEIDHPFCYGGTTMYMDGFQLVQGTTCVIYLFQSWVLDTGGKFAIAFIGTIIAGIGLEKVIQERRRVMAMMTMNNGNDPSSSQRRTRTRRLVASALFYGTQLTIGYMLMLVIMIYSGLLFFATVLGLVCGHVMFNAKDAIWPLKEDPGNQSSNDKDDNEDHDDGDDDPIDLDDNDDGINRDGIEFDDLPDGTDVDGHYDDTTTTTLDGRDHLNPSNGGSVVGKSCCHTVGTATGGSSVEFHTYGSTSETGTVSTDNSSSNNNKKTKVGGSCGSNKNNDGDVNADRKKKTRPQFSNHGVAEGATPCCQHAL